MLGQVEDVISPGRGARLAARLRASRLDRQLIDGADPAASAQLAARAAQLTGRPTRTAIADGLQRLLSGAGGRGGPYQVPLARTAISANAKDIDELAQVLRSDALLYAQGLAALRELVVDGTGPAYGPGAGEELARMLRKARAAL